MQRREFLKSAATCAVASTLPKAFGQQETASGKSDPQEAGSMNQIPLTSSPGTLSGEMLPASWDAPGSGFQPSVWVAFTLANRASPMTAAFA